MGSEANPFHRNDGLSDDSRAYETETKRLTNADYAGSFKAREGNGSTLARKADAPVRLAHLHSSNGIYGAERWTAMQVKYLDADVVNPVVITVGAKAGSELFHKMLIQEGWDAEHIALSGKLNLRALIELRRILNRRRIQVLHTHGFKSDVMGYLATRGSNIKLVSTPHGWSGDEGARIRFYELVSRVFLRRFDRIYPVSVGLLEGLRERGFPERRLHLIVNAVDDAPFADCFEARRSRRADEPFNVLFVGRLCRPKGVFDLLEAFSQARFDCPVELRFIGAGVEEAALVARCRELGMQTRVRFVGAVVDVVPHLVWSSVLVLPSYSEGIPRAVMEACCAGVPVIGTAIPGIQVLIRDGVRGLLVGAGDIASLARALERTASDPAAAELMAKDAREYVMARHGASRQARQFEQQYRALLLHDQSSVSSEAQ